MTSERAAIKESRLDDLDRCLIAQLQSDPRMPYATLGARLGVTGMTAANRLQRMRQADLLEIRVHPNLPALGVHTEVIGLLELEAAALGNCTSLLEASPHVLRVDRVTGEYDIAFEAAFPSQSAKGALVRDLQSLPGVRRLVVHHRLETLKHADGWSAVFAADRAAGEDGFEIAPGARVPEALRPYVARAARWSAAVAAGDIDLLRRLSTPDVVFTMVPPRGAGTYRAFEQVAEAARVAASVYRHLWQRIIGVAEAPEPYTLTVDSINTIERTHGQMTTVFTRIAYGFEGDLVKRAINLGQLELADIDEPTA